MQKQPRYVLELEPEYLAAAPSAKLDWSTNGKANKRLRALIICIR